MNTVWGWGGIRFEYDTTIDFVKGEGTLRFTQDANTYRTKSGNMMHIVNGYRAMVTAKLWNLVAADAINIAALFDMISQANGAAISVYPRYSSSIQSGLSLEMICISDIGLNDVALVPVGQYIELEFMGSELLPAIPTLIDNPSTDYYVDESANQYIDDLGNIYTS